MSKEKDKKQIAGFKELWEVKNRIISHKDFITYKLNKRLQKLKSFEIDEIVENFSFKTMKRTYKDFCIFYEKDRTCHDMKPKDLNCYGCFCPNYKVEISFDKKQGLYKIGTCSVKSKFGYYKQTKTRGDIKKDFLVLSCANCTVPHRRVFIKKLIANLV